MAHINETEMKIGEHYELARHPTYCYVRVSERRYMITMHPCLRIGSIQTYQPIHSKCKVEKISPIPIALGSILQEIRRKLSM